MSDVAIRAQGLSKRFTIHSEKRTALKERIVRGRPPRARDFWALRDASFEISRGETFGIIGHNGSGKSTALKVLTGVYRPTSGSVEVNGRISALLELGAGFHPELTGRENIRLNGSILGLSRRQIESMMDDIVDFSGIEEFIDSPVKVYSSGMYVRLGFAIAVKLDPEILIVDEIIAVGDEEFQRKCYDYMYSLRQAGCTIVIVSHTMGVIEGMCEQAVWLNRGQVKYLGPARETVKRYMTSVNEAEIAKRTAEAGANAELASSAATGSGQIRIAAVEYIGPDGQATEVLQSRKSAIIRLHYRALEPLSNVVFGFAIVTEGDVTIIARNSRHTTVGAVAQGAGIVDFHTDDLLLQGGTYKVSTMLVDHGHVFDARDRAFALTVRGTDLTSGGYVSLPGDWVLRPVT